ncbi:SDR family oxidoreductase [Halostella sp. JP-L12]|uniref:SDR family NAD(P)-dependent oxidoreductase n=1 Tax=Halostella TaxID=1843185 RepID=UPI000EF79974|nr:MULTISPECIES: glucose 1-dehydrogenase [Halostella]NHN49351.1 SDR family oxidoreductase [Halostella sp. JP-L12]
MVGTANYDFSDSSVIVTGSTRGIGRGIAEAFYESGANVLVNSRSEDSVKETTDEIESLETAPHINESGSVIGVPADMGESAEVKAMVETAIDEFETVDILVNNAAVWPEEESMVEASLDDWNYTMDVNVRSQYQTSKLIADHMKKEGIDGAIVNVTSQTADRRSGRGRLYSVSNTAVNGLTWRMAHELASDGIRMNAVSTDITHTSQVHYQAEQIAGDDPDQTAESVLNEWGNERPMGRLGQPSDVADGVLFLTSDRASYVTGTILRVSGGGNLQ